MCGHRLQESRQGLGKKKAVGEDKERTGGQEREEREGGKEMEEDKREEAEKESEDEDEEEKGGGEGGVDMRARTRERILLTVRERAPFRRHAWADRRITPVLYF